MTAVYFSTLNTFSQHKLILIHSKLASRLLVYLGIFPNKNQYFSNCLDCFEMAMFGL